MRLLLDKYARRARGELVSYASKLKASKKGDGGGGGGAKR
jgi:hypothetical protein